jgi:SAM-dependent methyltransferase
MSRLPERLSMRVTRWRRPKFAYLLRLPPAPISNAYGMDRGQPVDRYYIERFLEENRAAIRGACVEVRDAAYTRRFGQGVTREDVLDIDPANANATIVGDLRRLDAVADATYDCVILTQVLQYIDDLDRAVREAVRILKPGGTILATMPCLQRTERHPHHWKFTALSAEYLFTKCFPKECLEVRAWGNVAAGMAIWVGLAREDLRGKDLDRHDPNFPCTISVRATKPLETPASAATVHVAPGVSTVPSAPRGDVVLGVS